MKITLAVLAAGLGSRFGADKQIVPIYGDSILLDYSIADAFAAGFDNVVLIVRSEIEAQMKAHLLKKFPADKLSFVCQDTMTPKEIERKKPWGTGHALLCLKELVHNPFLIINADDFYGRESYQVLVDFLKSHEQNCIVGYKLSEVLSDFGTVSRGICELDTNSNLKAIHETKIFKSEGKILTEKADGSIYELNPQDLCSMNLMGFTKASLKFYEKYFIEFLDQHLNDPKTEFYMPTVISRMIKEE